MSERPKHSKKEIQKLEQLRKCKEEINRLEYESDILGLQGKQEESYKKARAAELGKNHFRKLSAEYRQIWKKQKLRTYNAL